MSLSSPVLLKLGCKMNWSQGAPGGRGLGKRCLGSRQERQLLSITSFSFPQPEPEPGTGQARAPGAENQPSLRQAKGRRPMNHRCRPIGVSVAPTSLGREPGQFCRLQFRGCPGWSGSFALRSSEMSAVPAASGPLHPHRSSESGPPGRAGPRNRKPCFMVFLWAPAARHGFSRDVGSW